MTDIFFSDLIKKPKGFECYLLEDLFLWEVREKKWYVDLGRQQEPTIMKIEWFEVYEQYRSTGYGRRGYEILEKELNRLGFSEIILTVDDDGPKWFWEKMGFTQNQNGKWWKTI